MSAQHHDLLQLVGLARAVVVRRACLGRVLVSLVFLRLGGLLGLRRLLALACFLRLRRIARLATTPQRKRHAKREHQCHQQRRPVPSVTHVCPFQSDAGPNHHSFSDCMRWHRSSYGDTRDTKALRDTRPFGRLQPRDTFRGQTPSAQGFPADASLFTESILVYVGLETFTVTFTVTFPKWVVGG